MKWQGCWLVMLLSAACVAAQDLPDALPMDVDAVGVDGGAFPERGPRRFLQSEQDFPRFIGPISAPVLAKDPRTLTQAWPLFISNWIPTSNPVGGGNFQVYGVGLSFALTERFELAVCKGGYAVGHLDGNDNRDGWFNLQFFAQYNLIRDVDNQFLLSLGLQYEPQTGEAEVFQNYGDGLFTPFVSVGKEFGGLNHVLASFGYQFPVDRTDNSSFFWATLHLDRRMFDWFYPLAELNWYGYTAGGDHGIPASFGELDNLINLGTSGMAGHNLVTAALGFNAVLIQSHLEAGAAWEFPISHERDFLANRLLVKLVLRY